MFKKTLGSDNHSGVHPLILEGLIKINQSHSPSYGTDHLTEEFKQLIKSQFGQNSEPFFVFNGTAANVLCIKALLKSFEAVICTDCSHLNLDECSAPENYVGSKLIGVPSLDGKLTVAQIAQQLTRLGDQHHAQPKLVSITQPTEVGTVYSFEEMQEIANFCQQNNLFFHIDGARFIYACHFLGKTFKELTQDLKVDAISFGGTKNGLLFGEIVILFNEEAARSFKFVRKQAMQLPSKMRFLAQQFLTFLNPEKPLWKDIAKTTHEMTLYFKDQLSQIPEIEIVHQVQANSLYVKIPKKWTKPLKQEAFFYVWDEKKWVMRWMLSFDTTKEDIDKFISKIKELRTLYND